MPVQSTRIVAHLSNLTQLETYMGEICQDATETINDTLCSVVTNDFMDKMCPMDSIVVDNIFGILKTRGLYDTTGGRWAKLRRARNEADIYEPFTEIANTIVDAVSNKTTNIVYVPPPNKPPKSLLDTMAVRRPDGVGAQPDGNWDNLLEMIASAEAEYEEAHRMTTKTGEKRKEHHTQEEIEKMKKIKHKHLLNTYKQWWMRIHIIYDVKFSRTETERFKAVDQALAYMRQVLMAQLDRRFVIGFTLLVDQLNVILCDRSGAVMTSEVIDINKHPKRLIQLIAGFSMMTPEQLGWDTSMKIYRPLPDEHPDEPEVKPSYQVATKLQVDHGIHDIYWVFDVEQGGNTTQYVSVGTLSAIQPAEICSRATVVFEVMRFDTRKAPERTYALKRYWRSTHTDDSDVYPTEMDIYKLFDDNPETSKGMDDGFDNACQELGQLNLDVALKRPRHALAAHDITVNGKPDHTLEHIRRGLTGDSHKKSVEPLGPLIQESDPNPKSWVDRVSTTDSKILQAAPDEPVDRCHTQVLMPLGIPIKLFASLCELLRCFRDGILGHQDAHDRFRVLHRDISGGNLLIFKALDGTTFGRVIDYDNAQRAGSTISIPITHKSHPRSLLRQTRKIAPVAVDQDILTVGLNWVDKPWYAAEYIGSAVKAIVGNIPANGSVTAPQLWNLPEQTQRWPNWLERKPRTVEHTGTLPYMSAEVIYGRTVITPAGQTKAPPFAHQAIHDLESFLWVLVRICLTRKGAGVDMYRDELKEDAEEYDPELAAVLEQYFGTTNPPSLQTKKLFLMLQPEEFDNIIKHFHSYFDPLKGLVRQWWDILILGYKYRAYEFFNMHQCIVRLLSDALKDSAILDHDKEGEARVMDERRKHEQKVLATFLPKGPETPSNSPGPDWTTLSTQITPSYALQADQESPSRGFPSTNRAAKRKKDD
ncbi:hypothetical protein H0H93_006482 [Arthromyces matolae]|nr:hypothetical protein H0H93_006482 [Arthromyces matolae]